MHCRQGCVRFPRFPRFPQTSLVIRAGLTTISWAAPRIKIVTQVSILESPVSESGSREPDRMQAAGRAARCRPQPFGLGSTMHRAATRGRNATGRHYNHSVSLVKNCSQVRPVSFSRLFGLRRAPRLAGRTGDHTTPCVAAPRCQQCFQRRHRSSLERQVRDLLQATAQRSARPGSSRRTPMGRIGNQAGACGCTKPILVGQCGWALRTQNTVFQFARGSIPMNWLPTTCRLPRTGPGFSGWLSAR
jgi:hypothetical protein